MYKIAVLGERDSVLGFKALGLDVFFAEDHDTARRTLHRLAQENYAIIYLTEQLAVRMESDIDRYKDAVMPAIILIPGRGGSLGLAEAGLQRSVERAVGVDIS
jgi:V/A-type H+-transporting ATPase subunit F